MVLGSVETRTDSQGDFRIEGRGGQIGARAAGYRRAATSVEAPAQSMRIALQRFSPKALYLSGFGAASSRLREQALELIERTELNALVIDVKTDYGTTSYASAVPLAEDIGAQQHAPIGDMRSLIGSLHTRGVYAIARIVTFKDEPLASAHPELAVKTLSGRLYIDREHLSWTDPFSPAVWEYNIAIAEEAAEIGFDEIQFDYVRFPDAPGLVFAKPNTRRNRVEAVGEFLRRARERLARFNVFIAADVFGYVCWNEGDTGVGQDLERIHESVDYVSPMLYPSTFQLGIPDYRDPVAHPYEIVRLSLERARQRTSLPPQRFRPWLQAFRDYAFDRRAFDGEEIRAQIKAAEDFGSDGWMLWNSRNVYSAEGLTPSAPPSRHANRSVAGPAGG